jgi:hypothetical protein
MPRQPYRIGLRNLGAGREIRRQQYPLKFDLGLQIDRSHTSSSILHAV